MKSFRWTAARKRYRTLLTACGDSPAMTPDELKEFVGKILRDVAAKENWRSSELAMTIVSYNRDIDAVVAQLAKAGGRSTKGGAA